MYNTYGHEAGYTEILIQGLIPNCGGLLIELCLRYDSAALFAEHAGNISQNS